MTVLWEIFGIFCEIHQGIYALTSGKTQLAWSWLVLVISCGVVFMIVAKTQHEVTFA